MNSKTFIDLLTQGGADIQEIVDHLQVVGQLMKRTNQYDEMLLIVDAIELSEFPKLKEFVNVLNSAQLLNESGKNSLMRECMERSGELIIHTSNPELVNGMNANSIVEGADVGLDVREGQKIYKRSLLGDIDKLLK